MKALVISGGGSKGAFAGGVAEYLIKEQKREYDLYLGTSTGSLLLPHLASGQIEKVYHNYTTVTQRKIFSNNPFIVRRRKGKEYVAINHFNVLWQIIKGKRTFGESKSLRKSIKRGFTLEDFEKIAQLEKEVVVTVSNLTRNKVEYMSTKDCSYSDFCDWIWISCNYIPFMSIACKNGCEYADGGFGSVVPIREAIRRGATEVDAVILETENVERNNILGRNPFSLMVNLFSYLLDQVEYHNIMIGKLAAQNKNVKLNLFYTPVSLTKNSLIFNKHEMVKWWAEGYQYAGQKIRKDAEQRKKTKDIA
ncbi:patatin-like phospholipase family protein [Ascidiimonas aurantiaca]|uniref:patatin-like phospholipase family protein n=1 Tax=Ascidiimonas aurantiaca TaxID=1685432 RepID=UPI0030ED35CF